jgi:uncharacterized membrane protein
MSSHLWILFGIIWVLLGLQGQRMFVRYMRYQSKGSMYRGKINRWIYAAIMGPLAILLILLLIYQWHSSDDD